MIKVMVHCLYDEFVKTPQTEEEWVNVLLHNICFYRNNSCKLHLRLGVQHLELITHGTLQLESRDSKRQKSLEASRKISKWLWNNH